MNKGRFFDEFSPRSENSWRKVSLRLLVFEISLRTDSSRLLVIEFVYSSCKQHEMLLNVFPTFFTKTETLNIWDLTQQLRPRDLYLVEINSQMIGIVFNINFSTPLLNQTQQRTCLECFQTLSIEKCVPCLFVLNRYANRQHPYRWLLCRYHYTHVCLEIFILHNLSIYIFKRRASERVQYFRI